jgi:hypothetical protein
LSSVRMQVMRTLLLLIGQSPHACYASFRGVSSEMSKACLIGLDWIGLDWTGVTGLDIEGGRGVSYCAEVGLSGFAHGRHEGSGGRSGCEVKRSETYNYCSAAFLQRHSFCLTFPPPLFCVVCRHSIALYIKEEKRREKENEATMSSSSATSSSSPSPAEIFYEPSGANCSGMYLLCALGVVWHSCEC